MINKDQLKEIIEDLKEVCEGSDFHKVVSTNELVKIILSEACSYQRGLMAGQQKQSIKKDSLNKIEKPTPKQIYALKKLGKYNEGITKQEAFKIISKSKNG